MLMVLSHPRRTCDGVTRRELLQVGTGMLGMSLPQVWAAESVAVPVAPRAKSVLFVFDAAGRVSLRR